MRLLRSRTLVARARHPKISSIRSTNANTQLAGADRITPRLTDADRTRHRTRADWPNKCVHFVVHRWRDRWIWVWTLARKIKFPLRQVNHRWMKRWVWWTWLRLIIVTSSIDRSLTNSTWFGWWNGSTIQTGNFFHTETCDSKQNSDTDSPTNYPMAKLAWTCTVARTSYCIVMDNLLMTTGNYLTFEHKFSSVLCSNNMKVNRQIVLSNLLWKLHQRIRSVTRAYSSISWSTWRIICAPVHPISTIWAMKQRSWQRQFDWGVGSRINR